MKRIVYVLVFLLSAAVCNTLYSKTGPQDTLWNVGCNVHEARCSTTPKAYNIGKGLMFVGSGIAFAGTVWMLAVGIEFRKNYNPDTPTMCMAPYFALATTTIGTLLSALGTPFFFGGKATARKRGLDLNPGCYGDYRGFGLILEGSYGYAPLAGIRASAGYHFGNNLFVGGGTSLDLSTENAREFYIPVFASARYTFGSEKVNPFIGLDFGCYGSHSGHSFSGSGLYGALNLGIRIRTSAKNSVWIASTDEWYAYNFSFGLRAGYSF